MVESTIKISNAPIYVPEEEIKDYGTVKVAKIEAKSEETKKGVIIDQNLDPTAKAVAMMHQAFSEMIPTKQNKLGDKPKPLIINITDASHVCPLLERLCEQVVGYKTTIDPKPEKWRLKWVKPSLDNEEIVTYLNSESTNNKMINRYPDCQALAHKELFAKMMKHASYHCPETFTFIPPSFELPSKTEAVRLSDYMAQHPKATYIAKPQVGAQGDGICLFKELKDLPYGVIDNKDILVQRYLDKCLLLDGIKFDLRVYVVVIGLDPMQAFICDEGLARFCTVKYETPTKSNMKKAYMHLTNYSINKMSDDYVHTEETEDILQTSEATKRTLSSLYQSLEAAGVDTETLKQSILETCSRTMQVYGAMMQHQGHCFTNGKTIGGTPFQILGLDLLIDEKLKAWVLEINDHPSLNIFYDKEFMGNKKPDDEDICSVDMYVKSRLVADVIQLARKKPEKRQQITEFGSLTQIFPNEDDTDAAYYNNIIQMQRTLFYQLAALRNKSVLTSGLFEKLASTKFIKNLEIQKVELNLTFQSATGNAKQVDLLGFCEVLQRFLTERVQKKSPDTTFEYMLTALTSND